MYFIIGNKTNLSANVLNILIFLFMLLLVLNNIGICLTYVSKTVSSNEPISKQIYL